MKKFNLIVCEGVYPVTPVTLPSFIYHFKYIYSNHPWLHSGYRGYRKVTRVIVL